MKRRPAGVLAVITGMLLSLVFAACMYPYGLFRLVCQAESPAARDAFWSCRFESMCLFLGLALSVGGVHALVTRRFAASCREGGSHVGGTEPRQAQGVFPRRRMPITFCFTGQQASRYGWVLLGFGVVLTLIGGHFWLTVFLPRVLLVQ